MEAPTMLGARQVAPDTTCLESYFPLPGLGMLPVNAFVIAAQQPVLVDTGLSMLRDDFLAALSETIDPSTLRWIWLSHMDADHLGNLQPILDLAPEAKIVTNFLGMGKMALREFDLSRVHLLEPGATLDAGDRELFPVKPAYYDAPETIGFVDTRTRVLFSADAFGALMQAPAEEAAAIRSEALRDGLTTWAAIDAPWLGLASPEAFGRALAGIRRFDPTAIISGHLPVAIGMTDRLLETLSGAVGRGTPAAPDHDSIEQLMARDAA
ncbi:MAG: MBL fold metallo-hydrolase [Bauldia litoralis]